MGTEEAKPVEDEIKGSVPNIERTPLPLILVSDMRKIAERLTGAGRPEIEPVAAFNSSI